MATLERETKETRIRLTLRRGTGAASVNLEGSAEGSEPGRPGEGTAAFARHMLETLAKWSGLDLHVEARSKDGLVHHLVEDVAITLGRALREEIDPGRITRVGHAWLPMDDALVLAAVDLVQRPHYEGPLPDPLMDHVLRSIAMEAGITLHVVVERGRDPHHVVEAAFKAFALALAKAIEPRADRLSTKGAVELKEGPA